MPFAARSLWSYDGPYDVGMTGLRGFQSSYRAMMHCDVLVALGTDFPYPQFYPEKAKKIQVDLRGEQIGRRVAIDVSLIGTVKETINALLPLLGPEKDSAHLKDSVDHYKSSHKELDHLAVGKPGTSPLHPEYVAHVFKTSLPPRMRSSPLMSVRPVSGPRAIFVSTASADSWVHGRMARWRVRCPRHWVPRLPFQVGT